MSEPGPPRWHEPNAAAAGHRFPPPAPGTGAGRQEYQPPGQQPQAHQPQAQQPQAAPVGWPQPRPGWPSPAGQPGTMPSPYFALTIPALIVSFYIGVGIVALVYSTQVQKKYAAGDIAGARSASDSARIWGIVGCVVGGIVLLAASMNGL